MNDYEKLKQLLTEINVPFEDLGDGGKYQDICIEADASDKYVTISFEDGKFSFSN